MFLPLKVYRSLLGDKIVDQVRFSLMERIIFILTRYLILALLWFKFGCISLKVMAVGRIYTLWILAKIRSYVVLNAR